jgi:aspartyl-tRNA(Asn)/glutamyl-tRNA(Gln) amidotransferase subunit B
MAWQPVIGLEIHVQLATATKIFSSCSSAYGAKPNHNACIIDLGLPGVLPVLNKEAVFMAIKYGLATKASVNNKSIFARKNYFYPDLPKGYQISQDKFPIVSGGMIDIRLEDGSTKTIGITRAHLEEDAGKSSHDQSDKSTGIDLNRAGVPLLEIVSEPDINTAKEAIAYLKTMHTLVRYLDICSGNMQEGAFRCDANISVRLSETHPFGTKVEIKNLNSFKHIEKALNYEIERQTECIKNKEIIVQETRLYDEASNTTRSMRMKENANDYRYFSDPDLPTLIISEAFIESARRTLPELPWEICKRFTEQYKLSAYDAAILTSTKELAQYYEMVIQDSKQPLDRKLLANIIIGDLLAALNKNNLMITQCPVTTDGMIGLIEKIQDNTISGKIAKTVFQHMWNEGKSASQIISEHSLEQITDDKAIEAMVVKILSDNQTQLNEYLSGKDKLYGFFVGQIMKEAKGRANPDLLNKILKSEIEKKKLDV